MTLDRLEEIADRMCRLVGANAEAECRVRRTRLGLTRFANSHIHQHHGDDTTDVRLRVALDGRVASTTAVGLDDEGLGRLVTDTVAAARLQPINSHWNGVNGPLEPATMDKADASTIDVHPGERAEKTAAFVAAGEGLSAAGFLSTTFVEAAVATTGGLSVSGRATSATIDGIHQTGVSAGNGHQTDIAFSALDGSATGSRAARLAESGRDAEDLDPGRYEVVLAPECVATVVAFLGAYGFGGRSYSDGQSFAQVGAEQFDPTFQLVDDPGDTRTVALGFDSEGTPKRRLVLVEDGVTRAITHDRRTAAKSDAESTGHGNPESYFGPVPINPIVGAGPTSADDLIAGVERGIYVSTFNYCRILDPRTQVVTGLTRNGTFLIEDGRLSRPLSNLRFTQSFLDALAPGAIAAIGDDARYADCEFGPNVVIAPSMRLVSWNFTGGARG